MAVLEFVFLAALVAAALSALVLLLRGPAAEYIGPHTAYALWLVPALRMILPPLPALPQWPSLPSLPTLPRLLPNAAPGPATPDAASHAVTDAPHASAGAASGSPAAPPPPFPAPAESHSAMLPDSPVPDAAPPAGVEIVVPDLWSGPSVSAAPAPEVTVSTVTSALAGWPLSTLAVLWAAITAILVARLVIDLVRTERRLLGDTIEAPASLRHELADAAEDVGLRRSPGLRLCPHGQSPFLFGIFRPVVVVPWDFETAFTAEERRLALLHEAMHCRRLDIPARLAMALFSATQWFAPWRGAALRGFVTDQEAACDADVLSRTGAASAPYARTLVKAATSPAPVPGGRSAAAPALVLSMGHPLKERITRMRTRRTLKGGAALTAGLMSALLAATAAVLPAQTQDEDDEIDIVEMPPLLGGPETDLDVRTQGDTSFAALDERRRTIAARARAETERSFAAADRAAARIEARRARQRMARVEAATARQRAEVERARAEVERAHAEVERQHARMERERARREGNVHTKVTHGGHFPQGKVSISVNGADVNIDTKRDGIVILTDVLAGVRDDLGRLSEIDIDIPEPPAPPETFMVTAVEVITEDGERIRVPNIPVIVPERHEAYIEKVTATATRVAEMNIDTALDEDFGERVEANAEALEDLVDRCEDHQERSDAPKILSRRVGRGATQKILCFSGGKSALKSAELEEFVMARRDLTDDEKARFAKAQKGGEHSFHFHHED